MKRDATAAQISLLANLHFYTHAALALQQANLLHRYVFSIGITRQNRSLLRLLPLALRKRLETRDLTGFEPKKCISLWLPELIQRGLPLLGLVSVERGNWLNDHLFDWIASLLVGDCDVLHFVNGLGLYTGRQAKKRGCILICDMRAEHSDFQRSILANEYELLGLTHQDPFSLSNERLEAEYAVADYFVVPSTYAKRTYVDHGISEDRIFVVPYGVDFSHFDRSPTVDRVVQTGRSDDKFRVIYAGQIAVRKGIHYLIEAFKAFTVDSSELLLVGGFPEAEYERYVRSLARSDDRIKFVGQVPKVELRNYYSTASVFVLPSLADSFGLVTLEAMACGLPVIVTENSGSQEVVRQNIDGYIVPIRSSEAITAYLEYLYCTSNQREQMGQFAYDRARQFTWDRYAEELLKVYRRIFARQGFGGVSNPAYGKRSDMSGVLRSGREDEI